MQFVLCLEKGQIKIKPHLVNNFTKGFNKKRNPFMGKLKKKLTITLNLNQKHMLLLNRYPLLDKHLLIVAKPDHFEEQSTPLDYLDMEAMLMTFTLLENPVIFFNGGEAAGASQPHKHMQAVPMASFKDTSGMPLHKLIKDHIKTLPTEVVDENIANTLPFFEFKHEIRYFRYGFKVKL